eukprot:2351930-Rhodomonas_salina.2
MGVPGETEQPGEAGGSAAEGQEEEAKDKTEVTRDGSNEAGEEAAGGGETSVGQVGWVSLRV